MIIYTPVYSKSFRDRGFSRTDPAKSGHTGKIYSFWECNLQKIEIERMETVVEDQLYSDNREGSILLK